MRTVINFFIKLRLQQKFILITMMAIVVLMSILGYIAIKREKNILFTEVETQGRLLGETLAIPIINDLIYERLGLVEEGGLLDNYILEIFNRRDVDLLYIFILDEDGRVISHNNITEYGKLYSDPLTVNALKADKTIVQPFSTAEYNGLDFGVPLSIGKKSWGMLRFGISLQRVEKEIIATLKKMAVFTLFLVAAGFFIILLLSRRFIRPITQLANTMEKTGADFLDVGVEVRGHDELALLGKRFNEMIDRIRQANEELKRTHEKLIQSEKLASIGILASGIAHEINNPLSGLFNCLEMLKQRKYDPNLTEKYLSLIKEGLERIENTVAKLLWMARKSEHKPAKVKVLDAVNEVSNLLRYQLKKKRIEFINEIKDESVVHIDPHDFQQVLLNLFINSIQAIQEQGLIKISAYRMDSKVRIEVVDSGTGIEQENITRIFDPFFTTKAPGEGTGLGLWMTYQIINNYDGEITVESVREKGARFVITLPARQNASG